MAAITRRGFLAISASTLALSACAPLPSAGPSDTLAPTTPAASPPIAVARATTAQELLARPLFQIAHRGCGDIWTEHSLDAYERAWAMGADAIEISVCATADGVLVCHHDLSAARMMGIDALVSSMEWEELSRSRLNAREWLGPNAPTQPLARLEDVLAALSEDVLVFIEDKQGTNTRALLEIMDAQPRATERFVWKQWAPAAQGGLARDHGYLVWGYLTADVVGRYEEFVGAVDALGVQTKLSDESIERVVSAGLPVIAWEVRFHDDRERLQALGVAGMMCTAIPYLQVPAATSDAFRSGVRAAGDLPSGIDQLGWRSQPTIVPARAALRFEDAGARSYLMGSLRPPDGASVTRVAATLAWPDGAPAQGFAGISFLGIGDAPGSDLEVVAADGYAVVVLPDGSCQVRAHAGNSFSDVLGQTDIGSVDVTRPVRLSIDVTRDDFAVRIGGLDVAQMAIRDSRFRGGVLRLLKSYPDSVPLEFSRIEQHSS